MTGLSDTLIQILTPLPDSKAGDTMTSAHDTMLKDCYRWGTPVLESVLDSYDNSSAYVQLKRVKNEWEL